MSSPHAYKEIRLGASHTYPSSGFPFLEKELPKAGSAATPGKSAQNLQPPKTWVLVLVFPICCVTRASHFPSQGFNTLIYKSRGFG